MEAATHDNDASADDDPWTRTDSWEKARRWLALAEPARRLANS